MSLVQFLRQMALLAKSGISLERALDLCATQTSSMGLRKKAQRLSSDLRHGVRLSDAMLQIGHPFTSLHAGVILAAESTGSYDDAFEQLATWEENSDRVERKIKSLASYPLLVVAIAAIGTFILLRFLAPLTRSVLQQVNEAPALPTRILLFFGELSCDPAVIGIGLAVLAVASWIFLRLWRTNVIRDVWERWSLTIPLVGNLLWKAWIVRVARSLQSLLGAGLPMVRCIELAADSTGNAFLGRHVLRYAANGVLRGESLSQALPSEMMSRAFNGMLSVGETSGAVPEMLGRVADLHETELGADIESLFRATEPILMGVVGLIVLTCLICAFQPLYTLLMRL